MRICLITREYPSVTLYSGGIGTTFANLARELVRQGHETEVVTVAPDGARTLERDGVKLHLVRRPTPERLFFVEEPAWALAVDRALRRLGRFDVVLAAEFGGEAWGYARREHDSGPLVSDLTTSIAQILSVSEGMELSRRWRLKFALQRRLERAQTERADAILAQTQAILDWAGELWELDGIPSAVVPNMLDLERLHELGRGEPPPGFPVEGPVVAFSGRLEPRKGPHVLAEAMRAVWAQLPDAQLVVMGGDAGWRTGWMSDHLRALVDENHSGKLHLLGRQAPERLFPALARADVVALPSLWENFANTALEAMGLARPVVATSAGGFLEFIADGQEGVLVPPGNAGALADALVGLLSDRDRAGRLGAAAAERAKAFDVTPVTRQHLDFFEQIAVRA